MRNASVRGGDREFHGEVPFGAHIHEVEADRGADRLRKPIADEHRVGEVVLLGAELDSMCLRYSRGMTGEVGGGKVGAEDRLERRFARVVRVVEMYLPAERLPRRSSRETETGYSASVR